MLCYAHFQLASSALYASLQATRGYVFRDTLKMRLGTLSWILAAARGIDLATGALVGRLSDRTRSRWGRRKPFIALAAPFGLIAWLGMPLAGAPPLYICAISPLYPPYISLYLPYISPLLAWLGMPLAGVLFGRASPISRLYFPFIPRCLPKSHAVCSSGVPPTSPLYLHPSSDLLPISHAGVLFRRTSGRSVQCQALAGSGNNASAGCPALKACLIEAMASGAVFAHDAHETRFESAQDEAAIAAFFALVHIGAFTFWTSGTTLVYDALGQELTTDYGRRGQLFAVKGFFDLSGGLCGMLVQLVVYGLYPTDTLKAATVTTLVIMAYVLFAWVLLLWGVTERKAADTAERPAGATPQGGVPFTAAVIRMLRSPPYRWYLLMKIPTTFLGSLPFQLLLLFFQNTMRMEAFSSLYLYTSVVALLGGFLSVPLQLRL